MDFSYTHTLLYQFDARPVALFIQQSQIIQQSTTLQSVVNIVLYGFYPHYSRINTDIPSTFYLAVGSAYYQQTLGAETARKLMAKVTLCK